MMTTGWTISTDWLSSEKGRRKRQATRPPFKPLSFLPVGVVVKNPQRKRRKRRATMTTAFSGQFHSFCISVSVTVGFAVRDIDEVEKVSGNDDEATISTKRLFLWTCCS